MDKVFKNPSVEEARKILDGTKHKMGRVYVDDCGNTYLWDAASYSHDYVKQEMGLAGGVRDMIGPEHLDAFGRDALRPKENYQYSK